MHSASRDSRAPVRRFVASGARCAVRRLELKRRNQCREKKAGHSARHSDCER